MPCASTRPTPASACTLASLRPLPVPPMAMTASLSPSASASSRSPAVRRATQPRAARARAIRSAAASSRASGPGRAVHQPDARLAHQRTRLSGHGEHRDIETVQPPSRLRDEAASPEIALRGQHAVAGGCRRQDLEAAAAADDRIERNDRIRARRHAHRRRRRGPASQRAAWANSCRRRRSRLHEPHSRRQAREPRRASRLRLARPPPAHETARRRRRSRAA